jgi:hypothetical protein
MKVENIALALVVSFFVAPSLLLPVCWYRCVKGPFGFLGHSKQSLLALGAITISYAILVAGFFQPEILGGDYSPQRYATSYGNAIVMLLVTLWVLRGEHNRTIRGILLTAGGLVSIMWFYVAVISAAA